MKRVSDLLVRIRGDGADLETELNKTVRNLDAVGRRFERVGRDLTLKFTAPIVAAGAVATKLASDFDSEMTKIVTLVGVAESQVNDWRRALLEMGPAVGKGPQELARALFVVTSAGQRGAEALQIVERAAKASAAGLGDTAEIARTVTAAMQAYGPEALSAERATDILVATVREGNLEASSLAGALGRVLGIAAQVGVSFDQVGAFIATFTRLGVGAEEAVVALRGVLTTMIAPSQGARDALASVGLSAEDLRVSIVEKGLARTLVDLVSAFRGNATALSAVIPNVRALSGVLGTAAAQGEEFLDVADSITNSTGVLDDAFERVEKTTAFTFAQLRANLEALAIAVGDALAPTINGLVRSLLPMLRTLQGMDEEFIRNTARALALAAALGPVILAVGTAARTAATLANTLLLARTAGVALGAALVPGGAVIVGLGLLVSLFVKAKTEALQAGLAVAQLRGEIFALSDAERQVRGVEVAVQLDQALRDMEEAKARLDALQAAVRISPTGTRISPAGTREAQQAFGETRDRVAALQQELDFLHEAQRRSAESAARLQEEQERASAQAKLMMEEMLGLGDATERASKKLRTPAEVMAELEERLRVAATLGRLSSAFDESSLAAAAYQSALQELAANGLDETDARVNQVLSGFEALRARTEGVSQVMAKLDEDLASARALGDVSESFDANTLSAAAMETALRSLLALPGMDPLAAEVREVADALADLRAEMILADQETRELNEAVALARGLIAATLTPAEEYVQKMQQLDLALQAGKISQEEWAIAAEEARRQMEAQETAAARLGSTWEDEFASAVVSATGRVSLSFRAMADDIARQVARVIARLLAMRAMMAVLAPFAGGGGVGGALFEAFARPFGGARAMGGPVQRGRTYLVGERGPELFTASSGGRIVPNHQLAGGGGASSPSAGSIAGEILSRLGPPPGSASPEVLANDRYYRRLFFEMVKAGQDRGIDLARRSG